MRKSVCLATLVLGSLMNGALGAAEDVLEEVVVTATLRPQGLVDVPASVTVLDERALQDAGQQHFQDVMSLVPNLNWAGGSSRPRYFQIRGIGEREQYEGAPNPSVGFLIDEIDFSGIGMPATLFDVRQIEVLRGPQGTRFGANALAGLIALRSNDPEEASQYSLEATVGDYDTRAVGATATAPVAGLNSSWRLAVQQYRSDGFMHNAYLNRDTNERDELTGRFKWRWRPDAATTVDFALLHADIDNGYDAWSIDNSRTTWSDKPGRDAQRATGASARWVSSAWSPYTLTVIAAYGKSESVNSYDADWGNSSSWAPFTYDYFQRFDRDRKTGSLELRLASPAADAAQPLAWLAGAYALRLREDGHDITLGEYADPSDPSYDGSSNDALSSRYAATSIAVFGQLDGYLTERWSWSAGLRAEQRNADYRDNGTWNGELQQSDLGARDRMLGGQLSLSAKLSEDATAYAALSRGYKAGGFNLGGVNELQASRRYFAPEYLWNLESGIKATMLNGRAYLDAAVFYMRRKDLQVRTGEQSSNNPADYIFITENLPRGYNAGIETSIRYLVSSALEVGGSLGLLRTRASGGLDRSGQPAPTREQAHAPEYTAALYGVWRHAGGLMARVDVNAKDDFYFDVATDHDMRSNAYWLANVKLGYELPAWSAYVWVRNVSDEDYAVRGFYFGNEPPNFENKLYVQQGEPRQVGVTASVRF